MDEEKHGSKGKVGPRRLTVEEIERLPEEEFLALPDIEKDAYLYAKYREKPAVPAGSHGDEFEWGGDLFGDDDWFEVPELTRVREGTRSFYDRLMVDVWPTLAAARDFGVASRAHDAALREAVKAHGVTPEQLDRALGRGPALTALIGPDNPYHGIAFRTPWDDILPGVASAGDPCDARPMAGTTPEGKSQDRGPGEGEGLDAEDLFGEVIFAYTRGQALADGVLVDVTETAEEAGFRIPVALTRAVWAEYVLVPHGVEGQDEAGRLWDVLWMCRHGIGQGKNLDASEVIFPLHVRNDNRRGEPPLVTLKAVCGPDDDGTPCITIMMPDED
jgi:hypothetical protein